MIVGASISMLGYLSGNVLAVPRTLFALGRDGFLPRTLSHVHGRHRTPDVAIWVYGALVIALALSGTFARLAVLSNLAAFVLYILSAVGVWLLRRRDVRTDEPPYLMPGGPLVPVAACVANAWLIYATAGRRELAGLVLLCALAVALYLLKMRLRFSITR
jgi:amino acid transporter